MIQYTLFFILLTKILFATTMPDECSKDQNPNELTIISYHEIVDKSIMKDPTYTVSPVNFEKQINWLKQNKYNFIDIDTFLKYRKTGINLPKKAVLITFDDGYQSVYKNAYPVLKKNNIPFVIALVGNWLIQKNKVDFAGETVNRNIFLSKKEIREMVRSGLCEVASHTYDSHHGIIGNPQGNTEPAITTRLWDSNTSSYETQSDYKERLYQDLLKNNKFLKKYTGQAPRIIVWPYGSYNKESQEMAEKAGLPIGITLDDGSNTKLTSLNGLRRILMEQTTELKDLEQEMWVRNKNFMNDDDTIKALHVDLDDIYDENNTKEEDNLNKVLDRIKEIGVNTVFLKGYYDKNHDGVADEVYFPSKIVHMRADLLNRVSWEITSRTDVSKVYIWIPMLSWNIPDDKVIDINNTVSNKLTPFSINSRNDIKTIYKELARSVYMDGILFNDISLSSNQDKSIFAMDQYKESGFSKDLNKIKGNPKRFQEWSEFKTKYLDSFAMELSQIIRDEHPSISIGRTLSPEIALNKDEEKNYSQSFSQSLKKYDYSEIVYKQALYKKDKKSIYNKMINRIREDKCGVYKTIIELEQLNFIKKEESNYIELDKTIEYLYKIGINHISYAPFVLFEKEDKKIKKDFSKKKDTIH